MKITRIALLAALGLAAAALAGVGRPDGAHGTPPASGHSITVVAVGTVERVPDEAEVSFSVVSRAGTAADALAANSRDMRRVIDALGRRGVAKDHIQTQDVSLDARYDESGRTVVGYVARNSIAVTTPIEKAGELIDTAVAAGANEVSGPNPSLSDRERLYRGALSDAVREARTKAEAIAEAAGVHVGRVTSVVESGDEPQPVYEQATYAAALRSAPVEPGTQQVQAHVTVTFSID